MNHGMLENQINILGVLRLSKTKQMTASVTLLTKLFIFLVKRSQLNVFSLNNINNFNTKMHEKSPRCCRSLKGKFWIKHKSRCIAWLWDILPSYLASFHHENDFKSLWKCRSPMKKLILKNSSPFPYVFSQISQFPSRVERGGYIPASQSPSTQTKNLTIANLKLLYKVN